MCLVFFFIGIEEAGDRPEGACRRMGESAYLFVRNNIAIDVIGPEGVKYAPYLCSLFFFIFFMNLLEIIPGINFPVTSQDGDPAFMLAILTYIIFNVVGFAKQGLQLPQGHPVPAGRPEADLHPADADRVLLGLHHPAAHAGHPTPRQHDGRPRAADDLLPVHARVPDHGLQTDQLPLGVVTLVVASGLIVFELLVISIQAYIFTMLTAFYIAESIHGHGDEEHEATKRHTQNLYVSTKASKNPKQQQPLKTNRRGRGGKNDGPDHF